MSVSLSLKAPHAIDQSGVKDHMNYLNAIQDTPSVRLEAEFYQAEDIDGGTEGLMGSGNLNYLVLQSQQTNDARLLNNPFGLDEDHLGADMDAHGGGASIGATGNREAGGLSDDDMNAGFMGDAGDQAYFAAPNITTNDIPNVSGSVASISTLKAKGFTNNAVDDFYNNEINVFNNPPPEPPGPPEPPEPPGPPDNPDPPVPPAGDVDLTLDVDTPVLDIDLDTILDPIEDILGDIDIDIDAIIDNLLPGEHGLLPDISASVDAVLGDTQILGFDLSDLTDPLDPVLSTLTNTLDGVIDGVEGLLPQALIEPVTEVINSILDLTGLNGGSEDTDLLLNLGAVIPGFTTLDTALNIPLDPVEMLLGDIDITVDAEALVEDLGVQLFAVIEDVNDMNLAGIVDTLIGDEGVIQNIEGIIPEAVLGVDVVTDLLPDISESLATEDLLGDATDLISDVTDNLGLDDFLGDNPLGTELLDGGLLGGVLGGDDGNSDADTDTDLTLDAGIEVAGIEVPDINLDIPLDPVEDLVGDIDIDVDLQALTDADVLESIAADVGDGDLGGAADNLVTELGVNADLDLLGDNPLSAELGTETVSVLLDNLDSADDVGQILDDLSAGDIEGIVDDLETALGVNETLDLLGGEAGALDILPDDLGDVLSGSEGGLDAGAIMGELLGGNSIPDILPEPEGTFTQGLGDVVDTTPILGGLGGLLGGGGGGLFG
ncbi:MAG: hypothetical protein ACK4NR_07880 [Micavibrio sp.]